MHGLASVAAHDQPGPGWTVVLRRQPVRILEGRPEGGYTDAYEIVCCYCGDHPDLDYREVSPELQRIRGPYPFAAGVTAYGKHAGLHPAPNRPSERLGHVPACRSAVARNS